MEFIIGGVYTLIILLVGIAIGQINNNKKSEDI